MTQLASSYAEAAKVDLDLQHTPKTHLSSLLVLLLKFNSGCLFCGINGVDFRMAARVIIMFLNETCLS